MSQWSLPFQYEYMVNAMMLTTLTGAVCGFLSVFLMLKGWSLIGDALSHSVVPGVAFAYLLGWPFAMGAFISGGLAACALLFLNHFSKLKQDCIIGLIFTAFFGLGLFIASMSPTAVDIQTIVMGNVLAIAPADALQLVVISVVSGLILWAKWRDMMLVFFDPNQAASMGINPAVTKVIFFTLLSACTLAAQQTVGAFLVIAMVVIPGACAYLLADKFSNLLIIATSIGIVTSFLGCYISYFIDGATGAIIVLLQGLLFTLCFLLAPKYGITPLARKKQRRAEVIKEQVYD
ncbi:metal ABC transporter permease [Motilimonas pumila]|uniref:Metal ABC transporter permease n=1 Tax=Motilimonas pumila TaxID=2303987 RepID=A0A418YD85_9GAMM|nr:metal ABC transporter permease [Motilimonas pumila]RJG42439.1 metal ABC transporter permease [Motilimonas pumila]